MIKSRTNASKNNNNAEQEDRFILLHFQVLLRDFAMKNQDFSARNALYHFGAFAPDKKALAQQADDGETFKKKGETQ